MLWSFITYFSFALMVTFFIFVLRTKDSSKLLSLFSKLVWTSLILTVVLINLGGLVHNTGSSLACPDWPLCYGEIVPKMKGGILIEHSHRLLASLIGYFAIMLSIISFKTFGRSKVFKFSLISLGLVIFQGILGGFTVIYKLPTIISTAHLATSMIFLGSLVYLLHLNQLSSFSEIKESSFKWNKSFMKHSLYLVIFSYAQILLGASMRHLGLGGVCGTGAGNMLMCSELGSQTFFPTQWFSQLHMAHRYFAYFLVAYALYFAHHVFYDFKTSKDTLSKKIASKAIFLPALIIAQVILGLLTISSNFGTLITTLHLGGAALLFLTLLKMFFDIKTFKKLNLIKLKEKEDFLSDLISMSKPRLSMLVIFTAGAGIYLAPGAMSFATVVFNLALITSVVAGACTLNCLIEKDVDRKMKRTALRPLADRRVSPVLAGVLGVTLCAVGMAGLVIYSNTLTAMLGMIAAVSYVVVYTPLKQVTPHAVFVGAIPGALPPLMGYTAVTGEFGLIGLVLFSVLFVWQLPHFMAISLMYSKDYDQAGIKVFPNHDGSSKTVDRIFFYSVILLFVTILPSLLSITNSIVYLFVSILLGMSSLYLAYKGTNIETEGSRARWSKKFFFSTIIYLPLQLGLMVAQL